MSLSSSFTNSSQDEQTILSLSDESVSDLNSELAEVVMIPKRQAEENKKFERELLNNDKASKKWAKTQVDTVAAIKDAELFAKHNELERIQAEFQTNLANKEAEIGDEMRQIEQECGDLRTQIQTLEIELAEVKERRKHNLISVRTELQSYIQQLNDKQIAHSKQIQKLNEALEAVRDKHQNDLIVIQNEADNDGKLIDIEIQRFNTTIEQYRREIHKTDNLQNRKMTDSQNVIEMLTNEIENSKNRLNNSKNEIIETQNKYSKMQQELSKTEEQIGAFEEQLRYEDQQKSQLKTEIDKLSRSLWNARRARLEKNELI